MNITTLGILFEAFAFHKQRPPNLDVYQGKDPLKSALEEKDLHGDDHILFEFYSSIQTS